MKPYADLPPRVAWQVAADLIALCWVVVWIAIAFTVRGHPRPPRPGRGPGRRRDVAAGHLHRRGRYRLRHPAGRRRPERRGTHGDLLALRALTGRRVHRLARLHIDPARAWRRGDPDDIRALAQLEPADLGLKWR